MIKRNHKGFTLIELLVVIAIIGVLASVVLASLNSARTKAADAKRVAEVKELQKALEIYHIDHGYYPLSGWVCSFFSNWQTSGLAIALDPYLPTLPVDPTNEGIYSYNGGQTYCYYSNGYRATGQTNQQWYMIVFNLENTNASLEAQDGSTACNGQFFNYGGEDGRRITVGGSC